MESTNRLGKMLLGAGLAFVAAFGFSGPANAE